MTDIPEVIAEYYQDKARDLPQAKHSELSELINQLDSAVVENLYRDGTRQAITQAIDAVVQHPDSTWTREALSYRIRKLYYS